MFTKAFLLLSFVLARTTNIVTAFLPTLPSWPSTTTTRRSMVLREEYFQPHFHESTSSSILSETVVDRIMECAASTNDLCDVDEINRLVEGTFCCVGSTGRSGRSVVWLVVGFMIDSNKAAVFSSSFFDCCVVILLALGYLWNSLDTYNAFFLWNRTGTCQSSSRKQQQHSRRTTKSPNFETSLVVTKGIATNTPRITRMDCSIVVVETPTKCRRKIPGPFL